ncbi:hypothetical protein [Pantoea sp. A4]|uniref:hypothetical protein n=1 Tax=Pantoea sp. A4 TaxID=1225184 RepID=UPI000377C522|nr:hypothetical protein [Pantoea sp. A4]
MTLAEQLIAKGEKLGLMKGEELGLVKGEQLGLVKGEQLGLMKGERIGSQNLMLAIAQKMLDEGEEQDRIIRLTGIDSRSLAGMVADRTQAAHDR